MQHKIPSSLVYVNEEKVGYVRKGDKGSFRYFHKNAKEVTTKSVIQRIDKLSIPPDWENVWISKNPKGHLQATGRDSKNRKQYIYHAKWNEYVNSQKFESIKIFGEKLYLIREQLVKDLRLKSWNKKKVIAIAVKLMDEFHLRIGNKYYKEENGTYGLTTLRRKHLSKEKKKLLLKYKAKNGKIRKITVDNPTLKNLLKECSELPGHEIFRYKSDGKYAPINSQDINSYLREITSSEITAKDFRTWGGTVLTVKFLAQAEKICAKNPRKKLETTLTQLVAKELNNTVAVARNYYIHPNVLKTILEKGITNYTNSEKNKKFKWYNREEIIVLNILNS